MMVLDPRRLIRLSIELENQVTAEDDLLPHPGKDTTLYTISQFEGGMVSYFHKDIPAQIRAQIVSLDPETALNDFEAVQRILSQHVPWDSVFPGIGYYFAEIPQPSVFPDVVWHQGCYVIKEEDKPVSWAWSSDSSLEAAELAVETEQSHRRKGYARQVASAWAHYNMKEGKVAFYSHRADNLPSQKLAEILGVVQYARVTTYAAHK